MIPAWFKVSDGGEWVRRASGVRKIARALVPDNDPSPVVRREPRTRAAGAPAATSQGQPLTRTAGRLARGGGSTGATRRHLPSRRRACRDRGRCRCAGWRLNPRGAWAYTRHLPAGAILYRFASPDDGGTLHALQVEAVNADALPHHQRFSATVMMTPGSLASSSSATVPPVSES